MKICNHTKMSWWQSLIKAGSTCTSKSPRRKECPRAKCMFRQFVGLVTIFLLIITAASHLSYGQDSSSFTAAEARKVIAEGNRRWGKARVEYDKKTYEEMLSPDFYVLIQGRKLTRQEFIDAISVQRPGIKLTRFDATVLTVQQSEGIWVAVIQEKLEMDSSDGKVYSLWITRDAWPDPPSFHRNPSSSDYESALRCPVFGKPLLL